MSLCGCLAANPRDHAHSAALCGGLTSNERFLEQDFSRASARARDAVHDRVLRALHLLRDARAAGAVPGGGHHRRQSGIRRGPRNRRCHLRSLHRRRVPVFAAGRLDRRPSDRPTPRSLLGRPHHRAREFPARRARGSQCVLSRSCGHRDRRGSAQAQHLGHRRRALRGSAGCATRCRLFDLLHGHQPRCAACPVRRGHHRRIVELESRILLRGRRHADRRTAVPLDRTLPRQRRPCSAGRDRCGTQQGLAQRSARCSRGRRGRRAALHGHDPGRYHRTRPALCLRHGCTRLPVLHLRIRLRWSQLGREEARRLDRRVLSLRGTVLGGLRASGDHLQPVRTGLHGSFLARPLVR